MYIKEGMIVGRNGIPFLVVKGNRPSFTGENSFGIVNLYNYEYNDLNVEIKQLEELTEKVNLKFISYGLDAYVKFIRTEEVKVSE